MPTPRGTAAAIASVLFLGVVSPPASSADAPPPGGATEPAASKSPAAKSESYQQVVADYESAGQEFSNAYRAARDDAERQKLVNEKYPRPEPYADRMLAVAEKNPGDPAALDALVWIVTRARQGDAFRKALDVIAERHLESEKLDRVAQSLVYSGGDDAPKFLQKLVDKSPHRSVKGAASYALADWHMNRNNQAEAEKRFEEVVAKYADLPHYRGTLAEAARAQLHEIRNLAVGKVAPEIEGEDVDGKRFKLSDYRGKVVVLDFWGDW